MRRSPLGPQSYEDALEARARAAVRADRRAERRAEAPGEPREPGTGERAPGTTRAGARPQAPPRAKRSRRPPIPRGTLCACGCGEQAVNWHHGLRETILADYGIGPWDAPEILVPVAFRCHMDGHWSAFRRMRLAVLRDSVFEFAVELMGPAAYDELRRHYDGDDPRLDAILGGTNDVAFQ